MAAFDFHGCLARMRWLSFVPVFVSVLSVALGPSAWAQAPTLVVFPLENATRNRRLDVVKQGLSDLLRDDLATGADVSVVDRTAMRAALKGTSGAPSVPMMKKALKKLGASHGVFGRVLAFGPELSLDVKVLDGVTGTVVEIARVEGPSNDLYRLETELLQRLASVLGLQKRLLTSGAQDATLLLAFCDAMALADAGHTRRAERLLESMVEEHPGFVLARARHDDLANQLDGFVAARSDPLTPDEELLVAHIEQGILSEAQLLKGDQIAVSQHFGYRTLRANFLLLQLRRRFGPANVPTSEPSVIVVPLAKQAGLKTLLRSYFENARLMLKELDVVKTHRKGLKAGTWNMSGEAELARRLGLGELPDAWGGEAAFSRSVADFLFFGTPTESPLFGRLRPSLAELESQLVKPLLALFDRSAVAAKGEGDEELEARAVLAKGTALAFLERQDEAAVTWRRLNHRPKADRARVYAERLTSDALGGSPELRELDELLLRCEEKTIVAFKAQLDRLFDVAMQSLFERAERLTMTCKASAFKTELVSELWTSIAETALQKGDCGAFRRAVNRMSATKAKSNIEGEGVACGEAAPLSETRRK
jgi:TolB-like protein